jgi:hypothetical protein
MEIKYNKEFLTSIEELKESLNLYLNYLYNTKNIMKERNNHNLKNKINRLIKNNMDILLEIKKEYNKDYNLK